MIIVCALGAASAMAVPSLRLRSVALPGKRTAPRERREVMRIALGASSPPTRKGRTASPEYACAHTRIAVRSRAPRASARVRDQSRDAVIRWENKRRQKASRLDAKFGARHAGAFPPGSSINKCPRTMSCPTQLAVAATGTLRTGMRAAMQVQGNLRRSPLGCGGGG